MGEPDRCPRCGKKLVGEDVQDERDGSELCWCPEDQPPELPGEGAKGHEPK